MLKFSMGSKGLAGFARALEKGHKKSFARAFKGETFRLFKKTKDQLAKGGGYRKRTPLANLMAKKTKGLTPFKFAAKATAFKTKRVAGGGYTSDIGPSLPGKRGVHPAYLQGNIKGRNMKITRARQKRIAARAKERKPGKRREFYRKQIPKLGTHPTPRRVYTHVITQKEGGEKSAKNIAKLYDIAQRGEGWSKTWWIDK